ncbi:MAG: type II secretion system F family protein [Planctomycetota bacterium]|nr:type II secretion system F family protein [Planctomycetota bacterium]
MQTFQYKALSAGGQRVQGELAAANEQAALAELEQRRLVPVAMQAVEGGQAGGGERPLPARALGASYRQISELLRAGVPLLRALRLLAGRKSKPRLAAVFRDLAEGVAAGEDLATMMSRKPRVFPQFHVAMVRAGERGGFLEGVMLRLGQVVTRQAEVRAQIVGSLVYPMVLVSVGSVMLALIFTLFVPRFRKSFQGQEEGLPAITRFVLAISDALTSHGLVTGIVLAIVAAGVWRLLRRPVVRRKIEELTTRAPVLGTLRRTIAAARFCRMLGTMLGSGVTMIAAMQVAKEASGNLLMEEAIEGATEAVRAGQPLARPLEESRLFDDDVVEMIAVGEAANNLDEVLISAADTSETRVDRLLSTFVRLIEPLMILSIALVVALVAFALILPMTKMNA